MKFTPWRLTFIIFGAMIIAAVFSNTVVIKSDEVIASESNVIVKVYFGTTTDKVFKYKTNRVTMHSGYYEFNSKGYNYKVPTERTIIETKN